MMIEKRIVPTVLTVALLAAAPQALGGWAETFDTNPIGTRAGIEGPNTSRDTWLDPAPAFTWTTPGTLTHNLCSNWRFSGHNVDVSQYIADGSRLSFPLGRSYTDADSFSFGARLRILSDGFYSGGGMQLNFGLTRAGTTGMDRTSSLTTGGDTYDSLEWDYFPDDNPGGWPTAQQVVFGTQDGAGSSFSRLAAEFGALLPTGPGREYGLPHDTWLDVAVTWDAATRTAALSVTDALTGTPYVDKTTAPDVVLPATWGDGRPAHFRVDQFSIMNYQNYWAFGPMPTLLATVEYDGIWVQDVGAAAPVAEPAGLFAAALAILGFATARQRRG